jgi:hypothetical protein
MIILVVPFKHAATTQNGRCAAFCRLSYNHRIVEPVGTKMMTFCRQVRPNLQNIEPQIRTSGFEDFGMVSLRRDDVRLMWA